MSRWAIVAAAMLVAACSGEGGQPGGGKDARTASAPDKQARAALLVAHRPPTGKDVIDAVLASSDVELSVSPTCSNVGTEPTDRTIGRYLAGFMAEMSREDARNWIETGIEPGPATDAEPVWVCRLTLRHAERNDRWGWGVLFHVRQRDGLVLEKSFTCTGAG